MSKLYLKVALGKDEGGMISRVDHLDIGNLFDGLDPGEGYFVSLVEITEEEYENLPDFQGF